MEPGLTPLTLAVATSEENVKYNNAVAARAKPAPV